MSMILSALIAALVVVMDYIVKTVINLPVNLGFSIVVGVLVFVTSAGIIQAAGRPGGAVFFGVIVTIIAVALSLVTLDILTLLTTAIYWTIIGFATAYVSPIVSKGVK